MTAQMPLSVPGGPAGPDVGQLLQQLLAGQQQIHQSINQLQQDMQMGFTNAEHNSSSRVNNAHMFDIIWLRNKQGQVPQQQPMDCSTLLHAKAPVIDPLLVHYGLSLNGSLDDKRRR
eukprot:GHUV01043539.1.p1 GENE.GHUV01043539.1~~GHUV01043539.1.p1  ORF type:complete len:117 (-),score=27.04 GHUV01043539.1:46-396(-)